MADETRSAAPTSSIQKRLRKEKDRLGWKPPWHHHFRVIRNGVDLPFDPKMAPLYTINCAASKCEAPGCPRTESGFPESFDLSRHRRSA